MRQKGKIVTISSAASRRRDKQLKDSVYVGLTVLCGILIYCLAMIASGTWTRGN